MEKRMDAKWRDCIETLNGKRAEALAAGGAARVEKQHAAGKLTARERMEALFDDGTFTELGNLALSAATDFGMEKKKKPGDGVIVGFGKVHGRLTFASSQDFTVGGGSLGATHAAKICRVMDLAYENRAPFISINDSGGARIEEGIDALAGYADIFFRNTKASGVIPQIAVVLGPCAGGACYSPAICDFIFMTNPTGQMYITGPAVVKSVTGEETDVQSLGGAAVHARQSGVAHFTEGDDLSCLNRVRQLLGYLPQNNAENPMVIKGRETDRTATLAEIIPGDAKLSYDVHEVIDTFVDENSFFEVQSDYAQNLVVGFARLSGKTVGIVANQSKVAAGALEINASDKGARFIRFCDCFNIPLISLVDVPAFLPGSDQEHGGIIRHGAKLLYAFSEATVPKICLILRKAYGGAYIAMNSKGLGADAVFALPIAEIAVMGASGAVAIVGGKALREAADPAAERARMIDEYNRKFMNPYVAAAHGFVDEVIHPAEVREKLLGALEMAAHKQHAPAPRKHGNIPL